MDSQETFRFEHLQILPVLCGHRAHFNRNSDYGRRLSTKKGLTHLLTLEERNDQQATYE
jgi:hypothetical protein